MSIDELNQIIEHGDINEFIRVCEARQRKTLSRIADSITAIPDVRLILLAGASSAGKTTTAKRLCTQLRVNNQYAIHFSTDDYFVGDARNPKGPDGEFDYETIEAVDILRLSADIVALLDGKTIHPRHFDFVRHEGYDAPETMTLPKGGCLVLEGIHALNPILTAGLPEDSMFRIFVEPMTQPEVFAMTPFKSEHARLLRRLVRDNQFRKLNPADTFHIWPKVIEGEEKWITPYRYDVDVEFDSSLAYELGVIKNYAHGLIHRLIHAGEANTLAETLCEVLDYVLPISPYIVPGDSILRETIGNSQLDY